MADIILLTESKISSEFNKYDEVTKIAGASNREDILPHDIHLNIALLGTVLSKEKYEVVLIDNFLHLRDQYELLEKELGKKPLAVGLSTTFFYDGHSVKHVTDIIRKISPDSHIILGGPSLLQFPELIQYGDISVLYDGEEVILKIMDALKKNKDDLKGIPGIYIKERGKLLFTGEREPIDMNIVPIPNWRLLNRPRDLVYPLETQRGCPYKCKYCTYPLYSLKGGNFRLKESSKVIEEIKNSYSGYGIHKYRICDSNFTTPVRRAIELCKLIIKENIKIEWSCYGRVDNMNDELANAMREAGCKVIFIGLESGSDTLLKNMNKRFKKRHIYRGIEFLKKAGIHITGSFIIGFPGETEETIEETKYTIKTCGLDSYLASLFWLDRNSQIWGEREKYNLNGKGMNWTHSTMNSKRAKELLFSLLSKIFMDNGPSLGSDFDIVTLVNLGLSYENSLQFIKDRHMINLTRELEKMGKENLYVSHEELNTIKTRYSRNVLNLARSYNNFKTRAICTM